MISGSGDVGMDPDNGSILFREGKVLNPIASTYFEWEGHKVPILYFPAEDSQGRFAMGMIISPTMDYFSGFDGNSNPVFNWSLEDIIKNFPLEIKNGERLDVRYTNEASNSRLSTDKDEFSKSYFSLHEDSNYQVMLWKYFLGEQQIKSNFDRNYESNLLIIMVLIKSAA
jgi:hypothetical protein